MLWWLSPGDPERRTGGFIYNARVIDAMRAQGHRVRVLRLDAEWPFPDRIDGREQLPDIPDGDTVVADGLMWTGLPEDDRVALTSRCSVWVVVHSPLDMEGGGPAVAKREREALQCARGWWATSESTARLMAGRLRADSCHCITPGTEVSAQAGDRSPQRLLSVAHVIRRKGHDRLFDALAGLQDLEWELSIVGSSQVDPEWAVGLRTRAQELGIAGRLTWLETLEEEALRQTMARHGLLVHPARYEAYGMVLTEALASGLPVLSTEAGALVGLESAAVMHLPSSGDPLEWSEVLRSWLTDKPRQHEASIAAASLQWPSWDEQARRLAALLAMPEV